MFDVKISSYSYMQKSRQKGIKQRRYKTSLYNNVGVALELYDVGIWRCEEVWLSTSKTAGREKYLAALLSVCCTV